MRRDGNLPSLFASPTRRSSVRDLLQLRDVAARKGEMLLSLFPCSTNHTTLPIPETLVKIENKIDPILLANDERGRVLRVEFKSLSCFFSRVRSIQLMSSCIHPSPLQLPKFVFYSGDSITYCKDQAEVLRMIETHQSEYTIQRFIEPKDEHARKYRGKWENSTLTVSLITRSAKIPFNNPVLQPIFHRRNMSLSHIKRKELPKASNPDSTKAISRQYRRKTFSNLRKFQHLAVAKGVVTPYTASFTCPDDCFLEQVQRQEVNEFMNEAVLLVERRLAMEGDSLQTLQVDVVQDHTNKLYLLTVKCYSYIPQEDLFRSKFGDVSPSSHNKSPLTRTLERLKSCVESPMRRTLNRASFIDLSDIQEKNIDFYGKLHKPQK